MNQEPCPACGTTDFSRLPVEYEHRAIRYPLYRCVGCALIAINPVPPADVVKTFYNDAYFEKDYHCGTKGGNYALEQQQAQQGARQILGRIKKWQPAGRLLEVGCAGGHFLAEAVAAGYQAEGVEGSHTMARSARERYGLNVQSGNFEEATLGARDFDVVCMFDVFEHFREPLAMLQKIGGILKPDGILVLDVPTTKNALAFKLHVGMLKGIGRVRTIQAPPYHLFEYTPDTMRRLLGAAGYRPCEIVPHSLQPWKFDNETAGTGGKKLALTAVRYANYAISQVTGLFTDRLLVIVRPRTVE